MLNIHALDLWSCVLIRWKHLKCSFTPHPLRLFANPLRGGSLWHTTRCLVLAKRYLCCGTQLPFAAIIRYARSYCLIRIQVLGAYLQRMWRRWETRLMIRKGSIRIRSAGLPDRCRIPPMWWESVYVCGLKETEVLYYSPCQSTTFFQIWTKLKQVHQFAFGFRTYR